jgi:hypothetical protein
MPWSDRRPPPSPDPAASVSALEGGESRARERTAAGLLGWFHLALALPVLAGVWFSPLAIDRVLSLTSAAVLGAVGGLFLWLARRLARPAADRGRR